MALTVNGTNTFRLLSTLNQLATRQQNTLARLSTGLRINHGRDDPAGLIALSSLDSSLTQVNAAISSNQRTYAMLTVADSALGEISSLLSDIQSLAVQAANEGGLTAAELAANQAQIDDAIASIDRIIRMTEFNGTRLLDGSLGIRTSGGDGLTNIRVYERNASSAATVVSVRVVDAAEQARTSGTGYLTATSASERTTLAITGKLGTQIIEIAAGESLSAIAAKINEVSGWTGVVASQTSATAAIHLHSTTYGSDSFVRVTVVEGSDDFNEVNVSGKDATVMVNGQATFASGKTVYFNRNGLSLSFQLTDDTNVDDATATFTVLASGGATFQLGTDASTRATLGIAGLYSQQLGTGEPGETLAAIRSGGAYDLLSDPGKAAEIAAAALTQITQMRGRIGGFQKYQVQGSLNALQAMQEGLTGARSLLADVDFATETAELNRQNVLMQSAITLLGVASQQPSLVLSLLS
jgi:flagellin